MQPEYLPPEAFVQHDKPLSLVERQRGDVFVFATLLWEIYSCRRPRDDPLYRGKSIAEICRALESGKRLSTDDSWPLWLRSLLTDCWNRDPLNRPSFFELARILVDTSPLFAELHYVQVGMVESVGKTELWTWIQSRVCVCCIFHMGIMLLSAGIRRQCCVCVQPWI